MRLLTRLLPGVLVIGAGVWVSVAQAPDGAIRGQGRAAAASPQPASREAESGVVSAFSFVRARPGQRERLQRFLQSNWLELDEAALQQHKIMSYRMLEADPDPKESSWDFAVVIDYENRQAMADFVPFYLALVRERPHKRVDGLDFPDLGEVVQQKVVQTVIPRDAAP